MMMIVDVSNLKKDFTEVCDEMDTLGKEIGVSIRCQREEILRRCTDYRIYRTAVKRHRR